MERMRAGEFRWIYTNYNKHKSYPNRPYCTRSQTIRWIDRSGQRVATIHRLYHRRSRTHPDPKELLIDGTVYFV
jgi:hypothetical protein